MLGPGIVVDDKYTIVEHIGTGGMGNVFKASDIELERTVALKILHDSFLSTENSLQRFRREGKLLSKLRHSRIVKIYRCGTWHDKVPYIAMEYLEGEDLQEFKERNGRVSPMEAIDIVLQVCDALDYLHQSNILHRDLKPTNIYLAGLRGTFETVKLIDFGLARMVNSEATKFTASGTMIGTITYMSPEHCRGESVDARSDIYSLGCVLYELLSGRPPFLAPNPVSMMHLHVNQPPADLQQQIPDLPVGLQNVVMRALAKIPARRYQTVADLVLDLSLVRDGHGTEIPETKQEPIHPRAMRANKVIFAIILMAMLTVTFSYLSQAGSRGPLPELTPRSELLSPPKLKELAALQNRTKDRDKQLRNYIEWIDHDNATADPLSLAQAHHAAAILLAQIEPSRDLDAHRRLALDLYEKAVASHPEPTIQNVQLCDFALQRSAELLSATNRWAEVERLQRSRVDRWRKYARVLPTARDQTPPMALALTDLSKTLKREGKNEEALRVATEAVSDPGCSRPRISSAFVLLNAACLNLELRPENPADQPARKLEEHPRSLANKSGKTMLNQALLIVDSCRTGDSVDWFSQAIERLSGLERHELALDVATRAEEFHARRSESAKLSTVCISKGKLLIKLERYREAEKALLKGVSLIRQLDLPDARLVQPYALLAESSLRLGNRVESCKFANASIAAATLMPSNEKISALFSIVSPAGGALCQSCSNRALELLSSITVEERARCPLFPSVCNSIARSDQRCRTFPLLLETAQYKDMVRQPGEAMIMTLLAAQILARGTDQQKQQANSLLRESIAALPKLPSVDQATARMMAINASAELGDIATAESVALQLVDMVDRTKALNVDERKAIAQFHLMNIYQKCGKSQEAIGACDTGLQAFLQGENSRTTARKPVMIPLWSDCSSVEKKHLLAKLLQRADTLKFDAETKQSLTNLVLNQTPSNL